jgi:hypothetical protein
LLEGSCIDNYITNMHPSRWNALVLPTTASDHHVVLASLNLETESSSRVHNSGFDGPTSFRRIINGHSMTEFLGYIKDISWFDGYSVNDVNVKMFIFLTLICCM